MILGVSAVGIALAAFGIYFLLTRVRNWPRFVHDLIPGLLKLLALFTGTSALLFIPLPIPSLNISSLGDVLAWVLGLPFELIVLIFGGTVGAMAAIVLGLLILGTVFDVGLDKKPDGIAKTTMVIGPVLAMIAIGPVADMVNGAADAAINGGANVVNSVSGE
ncbi:hypothetical protein MOQ72_43770 [Saccharopolyspora sp. K220]|uniref:hypothetical protein n=1 Tax=Saccharopolyspora soli TaxID=2926618 RepID=UPI001F55F69F|nr:hypothetical protein [Saccharopolyspora soli]MCI2424331.1 hypothetical protein [Saccharopolyspora soli]